MFCDKTSKTIKTIKSIKLFMQEKLINSYIGVRGWSPNVVFFSWVRCRGGLGACPRFYVRPSVPRLGAPPGVITPGAATKWVPTRTKFLKK